MYTYTYLFDPGKRTDFEENAVLEFFLFREARESFDFEAQMSVILEKEEMLSVFSL